MTARLLSLLSPKNNKPLAPGDSNLGVVIHYTALVGFAGHFWFIFLFLWLGAKQMALVNIASCLIFVLCFWLNRRGNLHFALLVGCFEVSIHAVLAVAYVGWGSGFHYYILALTPLIFYSQSWRFTTRLLLVGILCWLYVQLYFYSLTATPWVISDPTRLNIVGIINIVTLFIVFSALSYYYRRAATDAQKALTHANLKLETQANTDALTHLANRRSMLERIEAQVAAYQNSKKPFSLILSDIDDFKVYNDNYGHDAGDLILVKTGEMMCGCMRQNDQVGRWGGEEFLILLPGTGLEGAQMVAERMRERVADMRFPIGVNVTSITMTFGVAEFNSDAPPSECINRADLALYVGKRKGKNRVELYQG